MKWPKKTTTHTQTPTLTAVTPSKKKPARPDRSARLDERGRRIVSWPDDLEELEHPEKAGGWIDRRRTRGWLRRK